MKPSYLVVPIIDLVNKKNVNLEVVKAGDILHIEKNLYFKVFWPNEEQTILENSVNNNSLVCKLNYKSFSCLFTGDIEEESEKVLISKYGNLLKSTVLKVAHHGSNSSSTEEFLRLVNPKIALIGVGENNNFGHPSDIVLEHLQSNGTRIYRTDKDGEITIKINYNGKIKLQKFINNCD